MRLAALDPEAGAALRAVGRFDALVASDAGVQAILRVAAEIAGCPVRLDDPARRIGLRARADGRSAAADAPTDAAWPSAPVSQDGARLWLERPGPGGTVEAVVLERAAGAVRAVLARTRARRSGEDPASVELLLDATVPEPDRRAAARRLGLPAEARAVALAGGAALVVAAGDPLPAGPRAGVGPVVPVADLPASWAAARLALRLTAEGTEADPGPRAVFSDDLGALASLVRVADTEGSEVPDVRAVERAAAVAPWVLPTLDAVCRTTSLRDAARELRLHHSTLQDRLASAEAVLGWKVRTPQGRLRLQLALALRRALRTAS